MEGWFTFQWEGLFFRWGVSFLCRGCTPHGGHWFWWRGGFAKNRRMQGVARPRPPCPPHYGKPWRRLHTMQTTLIKKQITKKKKQFSYTFKEPWTWPIFPILGIKHFFLSYTTPHGPLTPCWVPEKTKEPIPWKPLNRRIDRPYSYDPSNHGQESYKGISQLSGIAVVARIRFSTTQFSRPH